MKKLKLSKITASQAISYIYANIDKISREVSPGCKYLNPTTKEYFVGKDDLADFVLRTFKVASEELFSK